jgi:hypothetical protein
MSLYGKECRERGYGLSLGKKRLKDRLLLSTRHEGGNNEGKNKNGLPHLNIAILTWSNVGRAPASSTRSNISFTLSIFCKKPCKTIKQMYLLCKEVYLARYGATSDPSGHK